MTPALQQQADWLRSLTRADHAISHARNYGVAIFDSGLESANDLAQIVGEIASMLGEPYGGRKGASIEFLSPMLPEDAASRSLSAQYGKGVFPWHTDTAHRTVPAKWVVMACSSPGSKPVSTEIIPWSSVKPPTRLAGTCSTLPFAFINGANSFLSTIVQAGREFIRFDPGCMRPMGSPGEDLLAWLSELTPGHGKSSCIEWITGRILILDNWMHLHRRHDASDSIGRTLIRAYAA